MKNQLTVKRLFFIFILFALISFTPGAVKLTPNHHPVNKQGLVAWWVYRNTGSVSATGTWKDYSGNGSDGTLVGNTFVDNQGVNFDGSGAYVTIPAYSLFDFGSGNFTISFWLYLNSTSRASFFGSGSAVSPFSIWIDYNATGAQKLGIWASSNNSSWNLIIADPGGNGICNTTITQTTWHQIVFTRSGDFWRVYLDTILDKEINVSGTVNAVNSTWEMGRQGSYNFFLNGKMANIQIYNRALPAGEIKQLYLKNKRQASTSSPGSPVYTVSGAGSSIVNGDYYLISLGKWKHVTNNIYMGNNGESDGTYDYVIISSDTSMPTVSDASVYYSWLQEDTVPSFAPLPIFDSSETIGTAGTAAFPTITYY